jgi:hypothetical protein
MNLQEFLRPWKLFSLAIGLAWLLYGALNYNISDWDVGISLIMALLSYITAPWTCRVLLGLAQGRFSIVNICGALSFYWFTVDGVYVIYHTLMGNETYRWENFLASSCLYALCGMIWLYNGSLADGYRDIRAAVISFFRA